jgi:hypothetical protein
MAFPVIERELKRASRNRRTYLFRSTVAGVGALILVISMASAQANATLGSVYFAVIQGVLFLYCVMEGVRATSDSLSEEERVGTLGLLFLTELTGLDVVLGKLVSQALNSFYLFLGLLPLSGMALILGGVTAQQFWQASLLLFCFLLFCLACGIFASSRSVNAGSSGILSAVVILLLSVAPAIPWFWLGRWGWPALCSPSYVLWSIAAPKFIGPARGYSATLVLMLGVTALLILIASRRVERLRSTLKERSRIQLSDRSPVVRFLDTPRFRRAALEKNPIRYLLVRHWTTRVFIFSLSFLCLVMGTVTAGSGSSISMWTGLVVCWISLKLCLLTLMFRTVGLFGSMGEPASLELLLTTPVSHKELLQSWTDGLYRIYLIPCILIFVGGGIGAFGLLFHNSNDGNLGLGALGVYFPIFAADYHSARWVSLANALKERRGRKAFHRSVFSVVVLPWLIAPLPVLNVIAFVTLPIYWCCWGYDRSIKGFPMWSEGGQPKKSWFARNELEGDRGLRPGMAA